MFWVFITPKTSNPMASRKLSPPDMPNWPRFLSLDLAAAYLGVSSNTFKWEVSRGIWPQAIRRGPTSFRMTWDRFAIDRKANKVSGLGGDDMDAAGDELDRKLERWGT